MTCVSRFKNCSRLPFEQMQTLGYDPKTQVTIVKCTSWMRNPILARQP